MRETRLAYIAGLIEADGGFSISKSTNSQGYTQYDPLIRIKSTHLPTIKWVVSKFGGSYLQSKSQNPNYKKAYEWKYTSDVHASRFLDSILPFLWIKKDQAILLQHYYALRGIMCPDKREMLYQSMVALNQSEPVTTNMSRLLSKKTNQNAYFAGIFDGEGSAYIIKVKQTNSSGVYYRSGLSISMSEKIIIDRLKNTYKGHTRMRPPHNGIRNMYEWSLKDNRLKERFLLSTLPYLITKREQAKLVLNVTRLHGDVNPNYREDAFIKCSILNGK